MNTVVPFRAGTVAAIPRATHRPLRELWLLAVARFTPAPSAAPMQHDAAAEAAWLRAEAFSLPSNQGGFKADLLAAADRHERLHGL